MFPIWTAKGREIVYRQGGKLNSIPVKTAPDFTAGTPKTLFEGRFLTGYDIAPGGEKFLMVANEQGTWPAQIHVVLNWTDELRRLVPSGN
jgi:hypothetical protein